MLGANGVKQSRRDANEFSVSDGVDSIAAGHRGDDVEFSDRIILSIFPQDFYSIVFLVERSQSAIWGS